MTLGEIQASLEQRRPGATKAVQEMNGNPTAEQRKQYAQGWVKQPGLHDVLLTFGQAALAGVVAGIALRQALEEAKWQLRDKNQVNRDAAAKLQPFFTGLPVQPKYYSLGAGAHGGAGVGMAGFEAGSIWNADEF